MERFDSRVQYESERPKDASGTFILNQPHGMASGERFQEALQAWHAGDAERVLSLCERPAGEPARLLRARALLRLRRMDEAIALLELAPAAERGPDEAAAAEMLLGTAYARSGDLERGLDLLRKAGRRRPHDLEVRSEIALGIALAHYQNRDFEAAERVLQDIDPASDLVYARALELRGWIAKCRNDFPAAVDAFNAALAQLDRCRHFDRFLEANLIAVLGYIAIELLDFAGWDALLGRARVMRWDSNGLEYYRFWFEMNRSMADEIAGRPREALQAARNAAAHAPSRAFRLFAACRRAAVLFSYGELLGFGDLSASIRAEFEAVDLSELHEFEEVNLPVVVAETLALIGDGPGATAVLDRVETMSPAQLALLDDEPMKRAYVAFVQGQVADANNDAFQAQHRYREALRTFTEIGMRRRALLAALRLGALNRDPELLALVEDSARALPAASWIRTSSIRLAAWRDDALLATLTRAERGVLELLHAGKSTAEIAELRGRSPQTIRNTVSKLLRTFSVDNRQALVNECTRRGAFLPTA